MKKYRFLYPAIFVQDEDNSYQVIFPDLDISTSGQNLSEAYLYAKDLLRVFFSYVLRYDLEYSKPTKLENILSKCKKDEIAMYLDAYLDAPNKD